MKNIKVLGSGCAKCKDTLSLITQVAEQLGVAINLEKVEDPVQIMSYGVMTTPAVIIDEVIVHKGGLPSTEEIADWITDA